VTLSPFKPRNQKQAKEWEVRAGPPGLTEDRRSTTEGKRKQDLRR
jgi:hypothetical protein